MKPKTLIIEIEMGTEVQIAGESVAADLGLTVTGHRDKNCKITLKEIKLDTIDIGIAELGLEYETSATTVDLSKLDSDMCNALEEALYDAYEDQDEAEQANAT